MLRKFSALAALAALALLPNQALSLSSVSAYSEWAWQDTERKSDPFQQLIKTRPSGGFLCSANGRFWQLAALRFLIFGVI